ncbi:MAG: acyl carrier protein [Candidatus Binatia bacterium]
MDDARAQALLDFVRRNFAPQREAEVTLDTPLLSEQWIDSMGVTLLAAYIEETFGVPFDGTELRSERLESIRAIVGLIERLS